MAKRLSAGARSFKAFLKRNGLTLADAGRAVGVSRVATLHWSTGVRTPRSPYREALEVWTRGEVVASSWGETEDEHKASGVRPYEPKTGTDS